MDFADQLRQEVRTGMDQLAVAFEGHPEKIAEMISHFIDETPRQFIQLEKHVKLGQWSKALFLIHKLKARYAYLGLTNVLSRLNQWENECLLGYDMSAHEGWIQYFKSANAIIGDELRSSKFFEVRAQSSFSLDNFLILVGESNDLNAMVFSVFIRELNGTLLIARSADEVIKLASEKSPDIVFLDIHIPGQDLNGLTRQLREHSYNKPIVVFHPSDERQQFEACVRAGANECVAKPVTREILHEVLVRHLTLVP